MEEDRSVGRGRTSKVAPPDSSVIRPAPQSTKETAAQGEARSQYSEFVYMPEATAGWRVVPEMLAETYSCRELIWRLFVRDFTARYRQSFLGYLWAILPVLITTATFTWLGSKGILSVGDTAVPYPIYVLVGTTVWQLFASGLTGATQSLVASGTLISKINFPREALVFAAFGQAVVEFGIRSVLVALTCILFHVGPGWSSLLIFPAMVPLCLLTVGIGFICALLNGVIRDIGQVVVFGLTFWMLMTPEVYRASLHNHQMGLGALNPVRPFVVAAHNLFQGCALVNPGEYAAACACSLLIFFLGWRVFHAAESRIAERI